MNLLDEIVPRMMRFANSLSRVLRAYFSPLAIRFLPEVRGIAEAVAFGALELMRLGHIVKLGTMEIIQ